MLGAEAYGPNRFTRGIQAKLVGLGYAVALPDYYRGQGPVKTDDYDDFTEVMEHIARLDFTRGARDLAEAVDALRETPRVDPRRVSVWGYCTGGTLAWLAACLRGDLSAAVLYFPSQPAFAELTPRTPVHPVDLLWQLTCPTLFLYGDQDRLLTGPGRSAADRPWVVTGLVLHDWPGKPRWAGGSRATGYEVRHSAQGLSSSVRDLRPVAETPSRETALARLPCLRAISRWAAGVPPAESSGGGETRRQGRRPGPTCPPMSGRAGEGRR